MNFLKSLIEQIIAIFTGKRVNLPNISIPKKITVDKLPSSVEEYILYRNEMAKTPSGGAVAFIVASYLYTKDPSWGKSCIIIQSDASQLQPTNGDGYKGYDLTASNKMQLQQLDTKPYIVWSYIQGTTPENGYQHGAPPFTISIEREETIEGGKQCKVFIWSTGADASRPIRLAKNEQGLWKAIEYSSLFVGVKQPPKSYGGEKGGDF